MPTTYDLTYLHDFTNSQKFDNDYPTIRRVENVQNTVSPTCAEESSLHVHYLDIMLTSILSGESLALDIRRAFLSTHSSTFGERW